jgi:lysophospholipase L1-like esterase
MAIGTGDGSYWRYGRPIRFWDSLAGAATGPMAATIAGASTVSAGLTTPKRLAATSAAVSTVAATVLTFNPAALSVALALWIKPDAGGIYSDAGGTPATNGGTVREIHDASSNAYVGSQATAGNRPTWRAPTDTDIGGFVFAGNQWWDFSALGITGAAVTVLALVEQWDGGAAWSAGLGSENIEGLIFSYNIRHYHSHRAGYGDVTPHSTYIQDVVYDGSQATNATKMVVTSNGRALTLAFSGTAFPSDLTDTTGFKVGRSGENDQAATLILRELLVYAGDPTGGELTNLRAYLQARDAATSRNLLILVGDSITHGLSATPGNSWASLLRVALAPTWQTRSLAVGGTSMNQWQVSPGYRTQILYPLTSGRARAVELVAHGTNDIQGSRTLLQLQTDTLAYWAARKASGVRQILAASVLPRSSFNAGMETIRVAYNAWLPTQVGVTIDGVADFAAIPEMADPADLTYYADGTHPTTTGHAKMLTTAQASITNLPATSGHGRHRGRGRSLFPLLVRVGL